jgi:hypothetical protein
MTLISKEIDQTKSWLEQVIIGLNFCPFAKKELINDTIYYHLSTHKQLKLALAEFAVQCEHLSNNKDIETSLLIYSKGFRQFDKYLDLVDYASELLTELGYEGIFQVASFHPQYCFDGDDFNDAANFTNRSPYPTIHLIREESMARVLSVYKNPEAIPDNNIELARSKGNQYFENVLNNIVYSSK